MRTTSRVESGRIYAIIRSAIWSPWEPVVRAVSSLVRRVVLERWIVDLLVLALAAVLVGATALCGLAVVSTWTPSLHQRSNGRLIGGNQEAGHGAFDVCGDLRHCQELQ